MPLKPHAFDVVFSNSLLEHLDPASQRAAAAEIRRVGRAYFVQVPYRYFPWEPHYNLPFVQFAPEPLKRFLWRRWWLSLGRRHQQPYERIYLPSRADMRRLFPSSTVVSERAGPVPKALYAWSPPTP
jgi:SAM-dependent methyltransferase